MARKISSSDIVLSREEELAIRARAAATPDPSRCLHFAPGTSVTIAGEGTFEVLDADEPRTTLRLRAADGTERTVLRPGA